MPKTLLQMFEEAEDRPVPDERHGPIVVRELSTTADNPSHKEDFNRLLDAAVRGTKSTDQT